MEMNSINVFDRDDEIGGERNYYKTELGNI